MSLVIFVDDSKTVLSTIKMSVDCLPINAKLYSDATVALEDIKNGMVPDLVVTDLNMPVMNGFEFLKAIRANQTTKRTPVLVLTTETKAELKEYGKSLGLTGWILKPFNSQRLNQAILRVLKPQIGERGPAKNTL